MTKEEKDVIAKAQEGSKSIADTIRKLPKHIAYKMYVDAKDDSGREGAMRLEMCAFASGSFWNNWTKDKIEKERSRIIDRWNKIFDETIEAYESLYGKEYPDEDDLMNLSLSKREIEFLVWKLGLMIDREIHQVYSDDSLAKKEVKQLQHMKDKLNDALAELKQNY